MRRNALVTYSSGLKFGASAINRQIRPRGSIFIAGILGVASLSFAPPSRAQNYNPVVYQAIQNQCHKLAVNAVIDDAKADSLMAQFAANVETMSLTELQRAVDKGPPQGSFMGGLMDFKAPYCANKIGLAYKTGGVAAIQGLTGGGTMAPTRSATSSAPSSAGSVDYPKLKTLVESLGYAAKEIGTGQDGSKFAATVVTPSFNVPLGIELSKSGKYIWLSASLGQSKLDGAAALKLLKRASEIQPTTLWITSDDILTIGMAVDNRDVTPAHIKFAMEKVAADVGTTQDIWQMKPASPPVAGK